MPPLLHAREERGLVEDFFERGVGHRKAVFSWGPRCYQGVKSAVKI